MLTVFKSFQTRISPLLRTYSTAVSTNYTWLRDACQCSECIHPSTRQKLFKTSDIPSSIAPAREGRKAVANGDEIKWNTGHTSFYPTGFLDQYSAENARSAKDVHPIAWTSEEYARLPDRFIPYDALKTPSGLLKAITRLSQHGLLFVSDVPNADGADASCELRTLAQQFGEIRTTFYGEVWDVKNVKDSKNIAYTNLDLGLHMDLLYFENPPRYQILHCLRNRVIGGESYFADALQAAETLRKEHPDHFETLSTTPIAYHYINDSHHLHYAHPVIELDPLDPKQIKFVNYSPPFQAPLPYATPAKFYPALQRFAELLNEPKLRFEHLMREGDAVLFDNRRVLHAREAFQDKEGTEVAVGDANRWLKGCYIEADAVLDRGRVLRT